MERTKPSVLSEIHALSRQGVLLPRPSARFNAEPYIAGTRARLGGGAIFFELDDPTQTHLVDSALRLLHAYDSTIPDDVFSDADVRASVVTESAEHAKSLIDYGWTDPQAVRLALRHSSEDIKALAEEYGQSSIFTTKRLLSYIASNSTNPRQTLKAVDNAFYQLRTHDRALQLSNSDIHKNLKVKAMRANDYSAIYALEQKACQPLSADANQALGQLRSFASERYIPMTSRASRSISTFVQKTAEPIFKSQRQKKSVHSRYTVDFPYFSDVIARYADCHDYGVLQDQERLQQIALCFMQEVAILEDYDIPTSIVECCVARMPAAHYAEAIEEWDALGLPWGKRNAILKQTPLQAPDKLRTIGKRYTELQALDPSLTESNALEIARAAAEGLQTAEAQLQRFYEDVEVSLALYGAVLTRGYIVHSCAYFPGTYMRQLAKTHNRVEDYTRRWHDPCMPQNFLQRAAESALADAPTIVRQHFATARMLRKLCAKNGLIIDDAELWRLVRSKVSDTRI